MLKLLTVSALFLGLAMGAESSSESTSSESTSSESTSSESTSSESTSESTSGESVGSTTTTTTTTTTTSGATTTYAVQKHNDVTSNYYYSDLDGSYFAFAIGQCTQKSIIGASYMTATCLDTEHLQVDLHYLSSCSDSPYSTETYTSANATFYCAGTNDYAKVTISASGCSSTTYDVYTALDVCVKASTAYSVYTSVYCSGTTGEIQYYVSSTCADAAFYNVAKMNSTCEYLFTTTSGSATKIYGLIADCYTGATTTTTQGSSSSIAANNYNIFTAVALLFSAVLYVATL